LLPLKDKKTLQKIFGILETNAIYISLPTGTEICGLFPTASLLQHSCLPNVSYEFDMKNSFKITANAATNLKINDELTTSYSHVIWPTFMRLQHLKETKYFECSCKRCCDATELGTHFSTLRCIGTDEEACNGLQLPTNPNSLEKIEWACTKCPVKVSLEHVSFLTNRMSEEIDNALASDPSAHDLESLIEKLSPFLHPNHYLFFNLKHSLLQIYGNKGSTYSSLSIDVLQKKLNICDDLLKITNVLDPYAIRIRFYISIILYEKAQCLIEMTKRECGNIDRTQIKWCLEEANRIIFSEKDTREGKQLMQKIDNVLLTL
jgi:SET domain